VPAALALAAGLLAGGASAEGVDAALIAGTCANCHGTDGRSPGAIPSIAGKPFSVLDAQLAAYKAGDATVMTRLALGFSDEELTALARHFSEIQP
jgi:sulfide dehydrogenase cytochrome subunit